MGEIPEHIKIAEGGLDLSDEDGYEMGGSDSDEEEEKKEAIDIDNI